VAVSEKSDQMLTQMSASNQVC